MGPGSDSLSAERTLVLGRTLRRAFRAWWDRLGASCALSLGWVICVVVPIAGIVQLATSVSRAFWPLALGVGVAAFGMGTAAVHRAVFQAADGDELTLASLAPPDGRWAVDALILALMQAAAVIAIGLNVAFYVALRSVLGFTLAVAFGYGLAIWLLACAYQWPLLIAGERGLITREDSRRPSVLSVIRNSLLLLAVAPGHAVGIGFVAVVLLVPLVVSGVGLALIAPALGAFLFTQAVRDHMIRMGMLTPPDEGGPMPDTWAVPSE